MQQDAFKDKERGEGGDRYEHVHRSSESKSAMHVR